MNVVCSCLSLPDDFVGAIDKVDGGRGNLEELSVDGKTWISIYRCRVCGQYWKEHYEPTGHGEVAHTTKIPPPR